MLFQFSRDPHDKRVIARAQVRLKAESAIGAMDELLVVLKAEETRIRRLLHDEELRRSTRRRNASCD